MHFSETAKLFWNQLVEYLAPVLGLLRISNTHSFWPKAKMYIEYIFVHIMFSIDSGPFNGVEFLK